MTKILEVGHERGGPGCSADCSQADTRHPGDAPADWPQCCPECGGSGSACYPACTDTGGRAFEEWEGDDGSNDYGYGGWDIGGAVDGAGYVHSDAEGNL